MRKVIILIFLVSFSFSSNAQSNVYKTWVGVGFEQKLKLKKVKFKLGLRQQFRVANIVYVPKYSTFTEIGLSKKITKFYKLGFSYRLNYINGIKHRLALANTFKIEKKPIIISFRIKYQTEFEKNTPLSQDFREKTTIKFKANKDFQPFVFGEILYNHTYNFSNFNEFRLGIGLNADYKKIHLLDITLMYAQGMNKEMPSRSFVLALSYTLSK